MGTQTKAPESSSEWDAEVVQRSVPRCRRGRLWANRHPGHHTEGMGRRASGPEMVTSARVVPPWRGRVGRPGLGGGSRQLDGNHPRVTCMHRTQTHRSRPRRTGSIAGISPRWWRGQDLNLRPSGYEPDELPDCSTPRREHDDRPRCRRRQLGCQQPGHTQWSSVRKTPVSKLRWLRRRLAAASGFTPVRSPWISKVWTPSVEGTPMAEWLRSLANRAPQAARCASRTPNLQAYRRAGVQVCRCAGG
jgi:hypothetical protein